MFANKRKHSILLPKDAGNGKPPTIASLVTHLCEKTIQDDRREMFIFEGSVYSVPVSMQALLTNADRRPGILVLINDADWELEGGADYELQPRDNILFVSTLHGG